MDPGSNLQIQILIWIFKILLKFQGDLGIRKCLQFASRGGNDSDVIEAMVG